MAKKRNPKQKTESGFDWFHIPIPPALAEPMLAWVSRLNDYPPFLNFDPEYATLKNKTLHVKTNQVSHLVQIMNGVEANKLDVYRFRDSLIAEGETVRQTLSAEDAETFGWRLGNLERAKIGTYYPYVSFQDRQAQWKKKREEKETRRVKRAAKKLPNEPAGSDRTFSIKVSIAPTLIDPVHFWLKRMSFDRHSQQFHFDPKTEGVVSGILFIKSWDISTLLRFANPLEASPFQVHKLKTDLLSALEESIRRRKNPSIVSQLKIDLEDAQKEKTGANHPWLPPSPLKKPKRINPDPHPKKVETQSTIIRPRFR